MQGDLTDLSSVQAWLGAQGSATSNTKLLQQLITSASTFIMNDINRDSLAKRSVLNTVDGNGNQIMVLREWPVISVEQVEWAGTLITTTAGFNPRTRGFQLEEPQTSSGQQRLTLVDYWFPRGRSNVRVTYTAGYFVPSEAGLIPTSAPYQIITKRFWLEDDGVTYANGAALTPVSANPSAGQYTVDDGVYTFSAADEGAAISIAYSYVPADLQQATTELVGERFVAKGHIGTTGQTLAGKESITYFSQKDMNAFVNRALQPYKRVTPA
jgi:hypothetical protein